MIPALHKEVFIKKFSLDIADFCILSSPPENRLSQFERLTLTGGAELERALQWIIRQCSDFKFPKAVSDLDISAFKRDAAFYSHENFLSDPSTFFRLPRHIPDVTSTLVHGLRDGVILDLQFKSLYEVQNPSYRESHHTLSENLTAYARYWQHDRPAKGTLIALHGWTMGDQRLNSLAFLPGMFYRFGLDVVLVELPFHGRRRPAGEASNLFPDSNLCRTNEAIAQIICDLRALRAFLEAHGARNVGCVGMSLGAYIAALWASLDPLAFLIPIVPVASMSEIAWRLLKKEEIFAEVKRQGLTRALLEQAYQVHSPLSHRAKLPAERVLVLGGLGDTIVPRSQPRLLSQHFGCSRTHWFRGGHLAQFKSRRAMTRILKFLRSNDFIP
ncbi:MAG: alpha/beta hydrolase [Deltaproteobacteria bacterium]|nr:alpha/beta hydrolase [Deltaproteobacteria bacterium]